MKGLKKLLPVVVAVAMLAVLMPGAVLADVDTLTGTFTVNSPPTVTAVAIYDSTETTEVTVGTGVDPTTEYAIKVDVEDLDGVTDATCGLSTVTLTLMYDSDNSWGTYTGGLDTGSGNIPTSGDVNYAAIVTCTSAGTAAATINAAPASYFQTIDPAATSWATVQADCNVSGDGTTRTFWFHVTLGKVACEAAPATDCWHVYAKATDIPSDTGDNQSTGRTMNWYGEVAVTETSVSFGSVVMGCTDTVCTSAVTATYIANGNYNQQIKTDDGEGEAWWEDATDTDTVLLQETAPPPDAGKFVLKADDDATETGSVQVKQSAYTTFDSGTMTDESGDTESDNHLWLSLGSSGITIDTYEGVIYYQIAT